MSSPIWFCLSSCPCGGRCSRIPWHPFALDSSEFPPHVHCVFQALMWWPLWFSPLCWQLLGACACGAFYPHKAYGIPVLVEVSVTFSVFIQNSMLTVTQNLPWPLLIWYLSNVVERFETHYQKPLGKYDDAVVQIRNLAPIVPFPKCN